MMIEFKGYYYPPSSKQAVSVLVQYDGILLHVWHTSEPFYRLVSSDIFRASVSFRKHRRSIKLPNGARVVTDDRQADALLDLSNIGNEGYTAGYLVRQPWTLALLSLMGLFLSAWMLIKKGLL